MLANGRSPAASLVQPSSSGLHRSLGLARSDALPAPGRRPRRGRTGRRIVPAVFRDPSFFITRFTLCLRQGSGFFDRYSSCDGLLLRFSSSRGGTEFDPLLYLFCALRSALGRLAKMTNKGTSCPQRFSHRSMGILSRVCMVDDFDVNLPSNISTHIVRDLVRPTSSPGPARRSMTLSEPSFHSITSPIPSGGVCSSSFNVPSVFSCRALKSALVRLLSMIVFSSSASPARPFSIAFTS